MGAPSASRRVTIDDGACVAFLQWALPRLGLRWAGYRRVRGTVRKRLRRRLRELGLGDLEAYRRRLREDPAEWQWLQAACRIPISRFFRDRAVFNALADPVLPGLARAAATAGRDRLCIWSAGCASGEEAYSLAILWHLGPGRAQPGIAFCCLASDADPVMLARAETACYAGGSLRDVPADWRAAAFVEADGQFCLRPALRTGIGFRQADLREDLPAGPFDLILCRNLAFTYFAHEAQLALLPKLVARLRPGGVLVLGAHERLPQASPELRPAAGALPLYARTATR